MLGKLLNWFDNSVDVQVNQYYEIQWQNMQVCSHSLISGLKYFMEKWNFF